MVWWNGGLHTSRISFIFDPPLPIKEPHWLAGTINFNVTGNESDDLF